MAKLTARGRRELWRIEKTTIYDNVASYEVVKRIRRYAYMSDNHLLSQDSCWWADGQYKNFGWKDYGKRTPDHAATIKDELIVKGYELPNL